MRNLLLLFTGFLTIQFAQAQTSEGWIEKGKLAYDSASYEEATEHFIKATEITPGVVEPWFRLGITYIELTKFKKAEESFLTALEIDSTNRDCWNDLGFAYNRMGKFKDAIPCFEKTIELAPDIPNPYAHLGYSYIRTGALNVARTQLAMSFKQSEEYNKYYFYAACYFNMLNKVSEAIDNLETAVEMGFKDKDWMKKEKTLKSIQKEIRYKRLLDSM